MTDEGPGELDAIVVGAGFAGLYALHRLRGMGLSVRVVEAGAGIGGTWYWNRYPGARCDVESVDYSYSFDDELQQEWTWAERYASQPEILRYLEHVADRLDLRRDIVLETRVLAAAFDEAVERWTVETDRGWRVSARYCVLATGVLSEVKNPDFPGLDSFTGRWFHTARWPHRDIDFEGERVGVVGTGSTGIQVIPIVARAAKRLVVFQRTPNFSVPARNRPLTPEYVATVKADYGRRRAEARASVAGVPGDPAPRSALEVSPEERRRIYEEAWLRGGGPAILRAFSDLMLDERANATAAEFVREKIRDTVRDPVTAAALIPRDHPLGAKRICVDTDYYETYNCDNVELVDVGADPIECVTPSGLRAAGRQFELDSIIFATGFDAITGAVLAIDIRGRGGQTLRDAWRDGPRTLLGLMTAGFPNLFLIAGPGSPSVLGNVVHHVEQHVDWIADSLRSMGEQGIATIEATPDAQDEWVAHVNELADATLYPKASSWFVGANIPGKPRVFMPYVGGAARYREVCDSVAADGYRGFLLRSMIGS